MVSIGGVRTKFIGRDKELKVLYNRLDVVNPSPIVLHGPIGSGKTALLRALTYLANKEGVVTVLIDTSRPYTKESIKFFGAVGTYYHAFEVIRSLTKEVDGVGVKGIVRRVTSAISLIASNYGFRGRLLLIIDDLHRVMSKDEVINYCKSIYEWIKWDLSTLVDSVLTVITVPHYILGNRYLFKREVVPSLLWNLRRCEIIKLAKAVGKPLSIDDDDIWYLTGGNPGALEWLINLNWDVRKWLKYVDYGPLSTAREHVGITELRRLAEDPDSNYDVASVLEDLGLMIKVNREFLISDYGKNLELGMGNEWAWQIPTYPHLILRSDFISKYLEH